MNRIKQLDGIIDEISRRLKNGEVESDVMKSELLQTKYNAMVERVYLTMRRRFEK